MNPALETLEAFVSDPRLGSDALEPECMPRNDGGEWPNSGISDPSERQKLEFLSVYYRLNQLHIRLQVLRSTKASESELSPVVADLRRAIDLRDLLEDRCATVGFDAEPEFQGNLAINLRFRHARRPVNENHRRLHPLQARVKIGMPDASQLQSVAGVPGLGRETVLADIHPERLKSGNHQPASTAWNPFD